MKTELSWNQTEKSKQRICFKPPALSWHLFGPVTSWTHQEYSGMILLKFQAK